MDPSSSPEELVRSIADALSRVESVRVVYLFGSRAGSHARLDSDLDLAILYDRTLADAARENARRDVLDELTNALGQLGERADVVDLERCGSGVAFRAIRDGRLALARSEAERVRLVASIARRYDDDAPKRALFRQAALNAMARPPHG